MCSPPHVPGQIPHKPIMKLSFPTLHPFLPRSRCPASQTPVGLCRRRGKPLTRCAADAQAVWGGHGVGRGEGRKKRQNKVLCGFFFFYILHREGYLQAGTSLGPLSGDHACPGALSPSSVGPLSFLPSRGLQPSLEPRGRAVRWWEEGLCSPFEGPKPLMSEGDGHLGNPSRTGDTRDEGLTDPTSTQPLRGRWVGKARVPACPALGRHPA